MKGIVLDSATLDAASLEQYYYVIILFESLDKARDKLESRSFRLYISSCSDSILYPSFGGFD